VNKGEDKNYINYLSYVHYYEMPFIDALLEYKNDVFVETGTFQGDTVEKVANNHAHNPSRIISLELSDVFVERCRTRFQQNPSVEIYRANSKYDLFGIIQYIDQPITFWLDSHWSGTPNVGIDTECICPILYELDQIGQHSIRTHTIMIDDIRLMNGDSGRFSSMFSRSATQSSFPVTLNQIVTKIYEINPDYKLKFYDDHTATNDVLVAYIP